MAIKHDQDKVRLGLIPPHALLSTGRALTYGAKPPKYNEFNYKQEGGLNWDKVYSALLRHYTAWLGGEDYDQESGLHHLDHMGACVAMLQDLVFSGIGKDTRFKND